MHRATIVPRTDIFGPIGLRCIVLDIAHHQQRQLAVHHALEQHGNDPRQVRPQLLRQTRLLGKLEPELGRFQCHILITVLRRVQHILHDTVHIRRELFGPCA